MTEFLQASLPGCVVGEGTYGGIEVQRWGDVELTIGSYTSFGERVRVLLGAEHNPDWVTTYPFSEFWEGAKDIKGHPRSRGPLRIGSDVWVGTEALILDGLTIGDGAVVAARAVVTKNVRAYEVVGGVPAKHIRWRFSSGQIEGLRQIAWWQWPRARIERALPWLMQPDIDEFIQRVRSGSL